MCLVFLRVICNNLSSVSVFIHVCLLSSCIHSHVYFIYLLPVYLHTFVPLQIRSFSRTRSRSRMIYFLLPPLGTRLLIISTSRPWPLVFHKLLIILRFRSQPGNHTGTIISQQETTENERPNPHRQASWTSHITVTVTVTVNAYQFCFSDKRNLTIKHRSRENLFFLFDMNLRLFPPYSRMP